MKVSEAKQKRKYFITGFVYIFIFGIFLALFYAHFFLYDQIQKWQFQLETQGKRYGFEVEKVEWDLWSQELRLTQIKYNNPKNQTSQPNIIWENALFEFGILSKSLTFLLRHEKEEIKGTIELDSFFQPQKIRTNVDWQQLEIKKVFEIIFASRVLPIQITEGTSKGNIVMDFSLQKNMKNALFEGQGKMACELQNIITEHTIPLLKDNPLENIQGAILLEFENKELQSNININNAIFRIVESGKIKINTQQFQQSSLDLQINVEIDEKNLNTAFVPQRTLNAIKRDGVVKMQLKNRIISPQINLL